MKHTLKLLALSLLAASILTLIKSPGAHAATLTVSTDLHPSACTLDEAIENINDQPTQTNTDCAAGDGIDDTITIPEGTVLLTADLPGIAEDMSVQGAGMGKTIISGANGQYVPFRSVANNLSIRGLTIQGFKGLGISATSADTLKVEQIEVNGSGALSDAILGGMLFGDIAEVTISNVYVHDLTASGVISVFGLSVQSAQGASTSLTVSNTTVSNLSSADSQTVGINIAAGLLDSSLTPATLNVSISNATIDGVNGGSNLGAGIAAVSLVNGGSSVVDIDVVNMTLRGVSGTSGILGNSPDYVVAGGALGANDASTITIKSTNAVLASSTGDACAIISDIGPGFGAGTSAGTVSASITSGGGNLSDDTSCSSYLTQPTDQNNLANLGSTLSTFGGNGGYVPTIPLLQGSPAVDSGVFVAGLTQDARLAVRPQGAAFDSGAYESPFTKPAAATLAGTGESNTFYIFAAVTVFTLATVTLATARRRY